jgi:hypothetical protein
MTKINKTEEIMARLRAEGKVKVLDTSEDLAAIERMNQHMAEVRRDFIIKNANSERSAANVILTC